MATAMMENLTRERNKLENAVSGHNITAFTWLFDVRVSLVGLGLVHASACLTTSALVQPL